jgi:hypothetical protein
VGKQKLIIMITQDINKKAVVEKLLHDKAISLDDALMLLEETSKYVYYDNLPSPEWIRSIKPHSDTCATPSGVGSAHPGSTLTR